MNRLQDRTFELIVSSAAELFLANSISATSIRDIALAAGCGEATIYRHYRTKDNLAVQAAAVIAGQIREQYFSFDPSLTGGERIRAFFESYEKLYALNPGYYRFLFELDSLFLNKDSAQVGNYEGSVEEFYQIFLSACRQGVEDGTVREPENIELFYFSSAHAMLSLCKALAVSNAPFASDMRISPETEIHTLSQLILKNIIKEPER